MSLCGGCYICWNWLALLHSSVKPAKATLVLGCIERVVEKQNPIRETVKAAISTDDHCTGSAMQQEGHMHQLIPLIGPRWTSPLSERFTRRSKSAATRLVDVEDVNNIVLLSRLALSDDLISSWPFPLIVTPASFSDKSRSLLVEGILWWSCCLSQFRNGVDPSPHRSRERSDLKLILKGDSSSASSIFFFSLLKVPRRCFRRSITVEFGRSANPSPGEQARLTCCRLQRLHGMRNKSVHFTSMMKDIPYGLWESNKPALACGNL